MPRLAQAHRITRGSAHALELARAVGHIQEAADAAPGSHAGYRGSGWVVVVQNDLRVVLSGLSAAPAASCQKCGGEVQGWVCQDCNQAFRETDDGKLMFDLDAVDAA
jgi:hypothetical protein